MRLENPFVSTLNASELDGKKSIGINIVRSLFGVQMADRINKSLLVTTGRITHDARRFVDGHNMMMSVIDTDEIHKLIRQSALKRGII